MNLLKYIFFLFSIIILNCKNTLPNTNTQCQKITIAPGIEDFEYNPKNNTFIIASTQRREKLPFESGVYLLYPETNKVVKFNIINNPSNLYFNPHGISLATQKNGNQLLYIISHPSKKNKATHNHQILVYQLQNHNLTFIEAIENKELLYSPNDIYAMSNGTLYISNDLANSYIVESVFNLKSGNIVVYNSLNKNWKIAVNNVSFANGVYATTTDLYFTTTIQNKLFHYSIQNENFILKQEIDLKGGDNIQPFINNKTLNFVIATHHSPLSFVKHTFKSNNKSPSVIYLVDIKNNKTTPLYINDGTEISAASTAFILKQNDNFKLYISQVFENFMLICDTNGVIK